MFELIISRSSDPITHSWKPGKVTPKHLRPLIGIYTSDVWGELKVGISANQKLTIHGGELDEIDRKKKLFRHSASRVYESRQPVKFYLNKDGAVTSLIIGQAIHYPRKK